MPGPPAAPWSARPGSWGGSRTRSPCRTASAGQSGTKHKLLREGLKFCFLCYILEKLKLLCVCRMTIEAKDIVINQCCWLTSLTGCECAVCIVCNITASVARRKAAACMVTIWWSSVPRWTGPLSSLCLIVIPWCPHPHTATPSPELRFYPPAAINLGAAQLGGWGNPSGQKSWTQIVVIASPQISGAWHRAGTAQL